MRILCAPDSFKESLPATAVADAMAAGIRRSRPDAEVDLCPIGDGGEGTLDALLRTCGGEVEKVTVTGPTGRVVDARLGRLADGATAVVELAEASGLTLVDEGDRDPTRTTTYGTGELLRAAAKTGCRTVIVGVGGSATVDGGAGAAQAFGVRFLDHDGTPILEPITGGRIADIARFEPPPSPPPRILVACDVTNPLLGENGAAAVYGPQKGATPEQVTLLDDALRLLAKVGGRDANAPGAGAAGGAAFGLHAFLGAELKRGIDLVLRMVGFDDRLRKADLVLTGEGRLDGQTTQGKAVFGVAQAARLLAVPTCAIVGDMAEDADVTVVDRVVSLTERFGREHALTETATLIEAIAAELTAE
jgi:glycerate kinase